jgi:hypothetical protein
MEQPEKKYLQSGNTDALVAADIKSYIDTWLCTWPRRTIGCL